MQTILQFIPIWNQVCLDTRTEKIVNDIKSRISEDTVFAIPDSNYLFYVHVDDSSVGVRSTVVQELPEGKRTVSFNSRIHTKEDQKMSKTAREPRRVLTALKT